MVETMEKMKSPADTTLATFVSPFQGFCRAGSAHRPRPYGRGYLHSAPLGLRP